MLEKWNDHLEEKLVTLLFNVVTLDSMNEQNSVVKKSNKFMQLDFFNVWLTFFFF